MSKEDEEWLSCLQVCHPCACDTNLIIPAGHVAVLPGYALQQVTCGLFQAVHYRLVGPPLMMVHDTSQQL